MQNERDESKHRHEQALSWFLDADIYGDTLLLLDERDALMKPAPAQWDVDGEPFGITIEAWSPERAEREYLTRFAELTGSDTRVERG